ncbi:MAG: Beta-barrel assembly-enhancing protease [Candidatus Anoxychlamydiales bacterium]|nr:Beta-barrel assembly-enhancing protease [Candidatus Anoxychlamydiales bacterium]
MKKKNIIRIFILNIIITSLLYFIIENKWVVYRQAENAFIKKDYCLARSLYVKSLEKGLNPNYINKKIIDISNILGDYLTVEEEYKKILSENNYQLKLIISLANFYIGINQDEKALLLYKNEIDKDKDNLILKIKYAKVLSRNGYYDKAASLYEIVLENLKEDTRNVKKIDVMIFAAREYEYDKNFKDSKRVYLEILEKESKPSIQIELVNVYLQEKKYKDALDLLKKIHFSKIDDHTKLMLVNFYLYFDELNQAKIIYEKYLNHLNMHSRNIDEKVNLYISNNQNQNKLKDTFNTVFSSSDQVLLDLAKRYVKNKMDAEAIEVYEYLDKRDRKLNIELFKELALAYRYLKKYDKAIKLYEMLVQIKPSYQVKKMLALSKSANGDNKEALEMLLNLQALDNKDIVVLLEIARLYVRENNNIKAKELFDELLSSYPCNLNIKLEYANFEAIIGHPNTSKDLFLSLLYQTNFREDIFFRFATSLMASANFYKAEDIYLYLQNKEPDNANINLKLSFLLASQERYEEAKEILQKLIFEKKEIDASYRMLSDISLMQNDINQTLYFAKKAYEIDDNLENSLIYFKCLCINNELNLAIELFAKLEKQDKYKKICLFYIANFYANNNKKELAKDYYLQILKVDPNFIEAKFNLLKIENKLSDYENLLNEADNTIDLEKYGTLYSNLGHFKIAIKFYQKALQIDPNCFFAKLSLSQALASNQQYFRSLDILNSMNYNYFPNYKISLWIARVLSWAKYYDSSIFEYKNLLSFRKDDPVIIREMARVASWAKDTPLAEKIYAKELCPTISKILLENVIKSEEIENQKLLYDLFLLKEGGYVSYEVIKNNIDNYNLSKTEKTTLNEILINLSAKYEIQKSITLEKKAKKAFYEEKYLLSAQTYEELIKMHPYNLEALFDVAQNYCAMNLCNPSKKAYLKLLKFDSTHNLAKLAYDRVKIEAHPFLKLNYNYFQEEGRGDLDRIIQHRLDFLIGVPIKCSHILKASVSGYNDEPTFEKNTQIKNVDQLENIKYPSIGYNIYYDGILSPYIRTNAFFSQKFYLKKFRKTIEGGLNLNFNLQDFIKLNLSFNKKNKLDNIFSLQQRIQKSTWMLESISSIKRKIDIEAAIRYQNFSDNNNIQFLNIEVGYRLTSHPTMLKFNFLGEYRNSKKLNRFIFDGSDLINIIHPYWTPHNYNAYRVQLEWFHDIASPQICTNQKRYYDLKLFYGNDTEKNPTVRFDADVNIGFLNHYMFSLNGYIHRSKLWDAVGINAIFKYQF